MDRRARKRAARTGHLLELAFDLLEEGGLDAVTMAALAEAADYAPASLYTYFASRSALLAAMQRQALVTLDDAAEGYLAALGRLPRRAAPDRPPATWPRWRASGGSPTCSSAHPRTSLGSSCSSSSSSSSPTPRTPSTRPRSSRRRWACSTCPVGSSPPPSTAGALLPHRAVVDPLAEPVDGDLVRTIAWIVALNGALLADGLTTGLPTTGAALASELTHSLLLGWGADPEALDAARDLADSWVA